LDWRNTAGRITWLNVCMGVLMIDKSAFKIEFMRSYSGKQLFKNRACLALLLKRRGSSLEAKRKIVMMANSPLFYAFGYEYNAKEGLNYGYGY
jgi:hypothetical protein